MTCGLTSIQGVALGAVLAAVVGCGSSASGPHGGGAGTSGGGTAGASSAGTSGAAAGAGGATCRQASQACAVTTDCCGDDLICLSNVCIPAPQCRAQSQACAVTTDCCADLICSNNVCAVPPQCRSSGAGCSTTGDCCSPLVCLAGGCRVAPVCGDHVCDSAEKDTCCADCGCGLGFSCVNGGACSNVGVSSLAVNIENECSSDVIDLQIYDFADELQWPGTPMPFELSQDQPQQLNIQCTQGSQLCYGGAQEAGSHQWGVGLNGKSTCQDCCFVCNGAYTTLVPLTCP
jgi:hypothetical protein